MNVLEQQLTYPLGERLPDAGHVVEVAPGIRWVRMPLPFALDHINLWLLRDEIDGQPGWTVVDCGITDPTIKTHWERIFDAELDGLPVLRVIVTHFHPDHVGLAHWICAGGDRKRWDVRLWMSLGEYMTARTLCIGDVSGSSAGGEAAARHFVLHGMQDADAIERIRARKDYYSKLVPRMPDAYRRMREGDTIRIGARDWRVITGFGHSSEHCALASAHGDVLISGDMVLPRISTNVSVFDVEPEADPLAWFLASLDRYDALPEQTLVLPSHGKPFVGLHTRLAQLRDHHAARLQEVRDACASRPCSAADILPMMFKRALDTHQITFAMGEALAHLHVLWHRGEVRRERGEDGVLRFAA
ncbi:MBL fold metallo-hydrolase [Pararobbsia silviterrae]|uniref:MBL fold metallo-hydrolase n=1 Tax=Pararobbsia silviterrae TaxID=1792498 RepID=A0A494YDF2_9BURK|nr:MBL fold metallo-hydrolase [Pararobbsia silviterrae]RKP58748.1 MBL fold metallo-hydrolase [Pararobbsia silviterrae]